MYILATAALAALANTLWYWTHESWQMPPWVMAVIILGSAAVVEALEQAVHAVRRRRARTGRRRRAHARPNTTERTTP